MAGSSQDTTQSSMNLLLGTVLLLLVLPGEWRVRGTQASVRLVVGFPMESTDPKTTAGFHHEMWPGQEGKFLLGCVECWQWGGFAAGAVSKPGTSSKPRVSSASTRGLDVVALTSPDAVHVFEAHETEGLLLLSLAAAIFCCLPSCCGQGRS